VNQDTVGRWALGIGLAVCAWLVYLNVLAKPVQTVDGKHIVPTKSTAVGIRRHNDIDHTIVVHPRLSPKGSALLPDLTLYESAGEIYTDPGDPANTSYDVQDNRQVPQLYIGPDVGTYIGFMATGSIPAGDSRLDVGLRLSPCRLFDVLSPDLLVGHEAAGVGLSLWPPADIFGHEWQHVGLGLGEVFDYKSGHSHLMPYAGLSLQF
jgi:hypothetical protein